jgi:hypothetical protein
MMKNPVTVTTGQHEETMQIRVWGGSADIPAYGMVVDQDFEFSEGMQLRIVSDPTGQRQVWDPTAYAAIAPSTDIWKIGQRTCPNLQCAWSLDCGSMAYRANIQFEMFEMGTEFDVVRVVGDATLDGLTVEAAAAEAEVLGDTDAVGSRLLFVGTGTDGAPSHLSRAHLDCYRMIMDKTISCISMEHTFDERLRGCISLCWITGVLAGVITRTGEGALSLLRLIHASWFRSAII